VSAVPRGLAARLGQATGAAAVLAVPVVALFLLVRSRNATMAGLDTDTHDLFRGAALDSPAVADLARVAAVATDPWWFRAGALVAVVLLWRRERRRVAVWLGVTVVVGGTLGAVLKVLVQRARPAWEDPISHSGGYSFPSGHALNGMLAAACVVLLLHPRVRGRARVLLWLGAGAFALVAGVNRVTLGVHYLSDVLAGWVIGLATAVAFAIAFAVDRRDEGLPAATPGEELRETPA
jgi:membrane-associated phospholipid phosphatase